MKLRSLLVENLFDNPQFEQFWKEIGRRDVRFYQGLMIRLLTRLERGQSIESLDDVREVVKSQEALFPKSGPSNQSEELGPKKAKTILRHGEVSGHPLSKKQKGLFGAIAGGSPLKKY